MKARYCFYIIQEPILSIEEIIKIHMITEEYLRPEEKVKRKFIVFMEESWPSIYKNLNNALDAIWQFIKDTVSSIWRKY